MHFGDLRIEMRKLWSGRLIGRWGCRGRCTRGWKTVGFGSVVGWKKVPEEEEGWIGGLWRKVKVWVLTSGGE